MDRLPVRAHLLHCGLWRLDATAQVSKMRIAAPKFQQQMRFNVIFSRPFRLAGFFQSLNQSLQFIDTINVQTVNWKTYGSRGNKQNTFNINCLLILIVIHDSTSNSIFLFADNSKKFDFENSKLHRMTSSTLTFLPFDDIWPYTYMPNSIPFSFYCSHRSTLCVSFISSKSHLSSQNLNFIHNKMASEAQKNDKDYQKVVELQALRNEQRNIVNNISTLELDLKEHK